MSVGHNSEYKSSASGHLDGFLVTNRTLILLCDSAHDSKCYITKVVEECHVAHGFVCERHD